MASASAPTRHSAVGAGARSRRGPLGRLVLLAVLVGWTVLLALFFSTSVAARTLLFLPDMFPNAPVRPIMAVTPAPRCEEVTYAYADTEAVADLCAPAGPGRHAAIVLTLGVHPLDRRDPFLVRLHDGLTRTNLVVLRPQSPDLTAGRVVPREIDGLVAAFKLLQARPEVDGRRIGLAGFSVGGALSTVAAADPRIRDEVRLVYSFGAYYDAFSVLDAIADHQVEYGSAVLPWTPHPWSVHVFAEQIIYTMPEGPERDYLTALLRDEGAARPPPWPLTALGEQVYALLTGERPVDGATLRALLPAATQEVFWRLSPAAVVHELRAPMYVMHDVGDTLIPFTESRRLIENLPPDVPRRYAEFSLFDHVMPRDLGEALSSLHELADLYQYLHEVFLALAE